MTNSQKLKAVIASILLMTSIAGGRIITFSDDVRAGDLSASWSTLPPERVIESFTISTSGSTSKSAIVCVEKKRENDIFWSEVSSTCRDVGSGNCFVSHTLDSQSKKDGFRCLERIILVNIFGDQEDGCCD